ncbi:MAG TPA: DUF2065 domain-containing protein [Steroidobacteraceae bacterium]|nr:DUF2065 domain-containing protein [Steroidobacteraceae bacterium]
MHFAWTDLLAAVSILLVLEGLLPFLNPQATRRVFEQLARMSERELRVAGLISMLAGLVLLFFVRSK